MSWAILSATAFAAERQQGPHEHGVGRLNVAVEGGLVEIELMSPGANIVGFEHAAEADADRGAVEAAVAILRNGAELFGFPADAGCRLDTAEARSESLAEDDEQETGEQEGQPEAHSEFYARYRFSCENADELTAVEVDLFDRFPATEELEAQVATPAGQGAYILTVESRRLPL